MESIKVFHSEAGLFQTITAWWLTALEQSQRIEAGGKKKLKDPLLSFTGTFKGKGAKIRTPGIYYPIWLWEF